jgi:hypothetical protein
MSVMFRYDARAGHPSPAGDDLPIGAALDEIEGWRIEDAHTAKALRAALASHSGVSAIRTPGGELMVLRIKSPAVRGKLRAGGFRSIRARSGRTQLTVWIVAVPDLTPSSAAVERAREASESRAARWRWSASGLAQVALDAGWTRHPTSAHRVGCGTGAGASFVCLGDAYATVYSAASSLSLFDVSLGLLADPAAWRLLATDRAAFKRRARSTQHFVDRPRWRR